MANSNGNGNLALDNLILATLTAGPLTTPVLAGALGEERDRIYRRCRRLEASGTLESTLVDGPQLLYCVDCVGVVTRANYATCQGHDLRSFSGQARLWERLVAGSM